MSNVLWLLLGEGGMQKGILSRQHNQKGRNGECERTQHLEVFGTKGHKEEEILPTRRNTPCSISRF